MIRRGLDLELQHELHAWTRARLRRRAAVARPELVDFTSNDVLGLAHHPAVLDAAAHALRKYGAGGRASRLLGGGCAEHEALEREAAEWLDAESALFFPSGFHANLGVIGTLAGRGDHVFSDRLNHASLVDGCRLSGARIHVFDHADPEHAASLLRRVPGAGRRVLVTESVFSMDGDLAPLEQLLGVCERHGAHLVVDEAHAVGLLGPRGQGGCADSGLEPDRIAARVFPCGKAMGGAGALVVGSAALREALVHRARTFVFTTAPPPGIPAALRAAVTHVRRDDGTRGRVLSLARRLAASLGLPQPAAAIVPVVVGDPDRALAAAAACNTAGFDVRAVRPPTVPEGASRVRIVCHAFNTADQIDSLAAVLREFAGSKPSPPARNAARRPLTVVGTDTDVGKTVVSALLLRAASGLGPAAYWKPVQTGTESDTETVLRLAGAAPEVALKPVHWFPKPASPHEAAREVGATIDPEELQEVVSQGCRRDDRVVMELAGGILVPYVEGYTQADFLESFRPDLVLVARSGLGTLNHTLLTLEALRRRGLEPRALFLVGPPHPSNRETLRRMGAVDRIVEVPLFDPLTTDALDAFVRARDWSWLESR